MISGNTSILFKTFIILFYYKMDEIAINFVIIGRRINTRELLDLFCKKITADMKGIFPQLIAVRYKLIKHFDIYSIIVYFTNTGEAIEDDLLFYIEIADGKFNYTKKKPDIVTEDNLITEGHLNIPDRILFDESLNYETRILTPTGKFNTIHPRGSFDNEDPETTQLPSDIGFTNGDLSGIEYVSDEDSGKRRRRTKVRSKRKSRRSKRKSIRSKRKKSKRKIIRSRSKRK